MPILKHKFFAHYLAVLSKIITLCQGSLYIRSQRYAIGRDVVCGFSLRIMDYPQGGIWRGNIGIRVLAGRQAVSSPLMSCNLFAIMVAAAMQVHLYSLQG